MKQTAVKYLIKETQKRIPPFYAHYIMNMNEVYNKALEMEKEQMIDKYENGYLDSELDKLMKYKSEE